MTVSDRRDDDLVVEVRGLVSRFGAVVVHDGVDLEVRRGEVVGIVGGSGSGKTVLLRAMILLDRPAAGLVRLFGRRAEELDSAALGAVRNRFGVVFQHGALFSSLTVAENTVFPLRESMTLPDEVAAGLAMLKLSLVGLDARDALKFPPELSGGMLKRAALARALAMDPELLFLDEPSAGLDPVSAGAFDELILQLKEALGITVIMISHDLDSLWRVTDRVAFLGEKRILACAPMRELSRHPHPLISAYFEGPRGRAGGHGR